jgi:hypothetical protein
MFYFRCWHHERWKSRNGQILYWSWLIFWMFFQNFIDFFNLLSVKKYSKFFEKFDLRSQNWILLKIWLEIPELKFFDKFDLRSQNWIFLKFDLRSENWNFWQIWLENSELNFVENLTWDLNHHSSEVRIEISELDLKFWNIWHEISDDDKANFFLKIQLIIIKIWITIF